MKIVLIVLGSLGAIYGLFGVVQLISAMSSTNADSTYGTANIAAHLVPICLGFVVSAVCFQRAFAKPKD